MPEPHAFPLLGRYLKGSLKRTLKQTSVAAVIVAVVGYYFSYQDRIDSRQQTAWSVLRTALEWSENRKWGNVGQIQAIETLTRDCDSWWLNTPLKYLLGRDCVDLKSLPLMTMDFGGLKAPGATLSHSYFACSNFSGANLARSHFDNVSLMAASLANVDFRGADLSNSCFFLADVSGAKFDSHTTVDPKELLKACVVEQNGVRWKIDAGDNSGGRPNRRSSAGLSERT